MERPQRLDVADGPDDAGPKDELSTELADRGVLRAQGVRLGEGTDVVVHQ